MYTLHVAESGQRPLDRGVRDYPTRELVALAVEGSGAVDRDLDAIARRIDGGAFVSAAARPDELSCAGNVSPAAVARLMAAFELARRAGATQAPDVVREPSDLAAIAHRELNGLRRERVLVIVCDAANRPLRTIVVSEGAIDRSLMPKREILNAVLRWDGRAFAVAHNHPCGDPEPSDADVVATREIEQAACVVGLRFLGHVVIADGSWTCVTTAVSRTRG